MSPTANLASTTYRPTYHTFGAVQRGQALQAEQVLTPDMQEQQRKQDLVKLARQRFRKCMEYESEQRREMREDLNFRAGIQWPDAIANDRIAGGRPCLTVNRIHQVVRIAVNEMRQNRAAIQINPVGSGADEDTAEVLQGMSRHIEIRSDAEVAYDTAAEHQVTAGRGWIRVLIDWVDGEPFQQEIRIQRLQNLFGAVMDVDAIQPDYSDAQYGFVFEDLDRQAFERQFPGKTWAPLREFEGIGDFNDWYPDQRCRVAEYWYKEYEPDVAHQLDDGTTIYGGDEIPEGREIIQSRDFDRPVIKWAKLTAREVLEERTWPGKCIPLVPVLGDEIWIRGKRQYIGIVRFARDPQRIFNYIRSSVVESVALAPKSPWVGTPEQFGNYKNLYEQANTRNIAVLYYNAVHAPNGQPLPPPQRMTVEPPIQALSGALLQSDADLKATTGMYDPSLGAPSAEQSGKAILARQGQAHTANFSYGDNQARAIKRVGEIIVDLIPYVYPEAEVVHIVKPDNKRKQVQINQPFVEGGVQKIYRVSPGEIGRYDVTVSTGPSYHSRRQEAVASMMQLVQSYPAFMQVAGDLLLDNMDIPGAHEMAERWRRTLPPNLQDPNDGDQQIPPQIAAQFQQMQQQIQQLTQMLQPKLLETQTRLKVAEMDNQTKLQIEELRSEAGIVEAALRGKEAEATRRADAEMAHLQRVHEMAMASADATMGAESADADREHQMELQRQQQAAQAKQQSYRQSKSYRGPGKAYGKQAA